ncbi:RHS repeat-associated core domain-containing protein [Pseudomonas sp. SIMBA_077]
MKPWIAALSMVYDYDPLDRLSKVDGRRRFYNRQRIATELEGPAHRCFFESLTQPLAQRKPDDDTSSTLLMTDQHSCVLLSLNTDGPQPYAYTVYGHRPISMNQQIAQGFNGERADSTTGHYLLGQGYRAFNPVLMRFNSPDSWSPFGKGGTNTYAYCKGDPINHQDPSAHSPLTAGLNYLKRLTRRTPRTTPMKPPLPPTDSPPAWTMNALQSPVYQRAAIEPVASRPHRTVRQRFIETFSPSRRSSPAEVSGDSVYMPPTAPRRNDPPPAYQHPPTYEQATDTRRIAQIESQAIAANKRNVIRGTD